MNAQNDHSLLLVTEIIQGLIALTLVGALVAVGIIEVLAGRQFSEPTTLAVLAGAAVAWYFRGVAGTQQRVQTLQTVDRLLGGGQTHVFSDPNATEVTVTPTAGNGPPAPPPPPPHSAAMP